MCLDVVPQYAEDFIILCHSMVLKSFILCHSIAPGTFHFISCHSVVLGIFHFVSCHSIVLRTFCFVSCYSIVLGTFYFLNGSFSIKFKKATKEQFLSGSVSIESAFLQFEVLAMWHCGAADFAEHRGSYPVELSLRAEAFND